MAFNLFEAVGKTTYDDSAVRRGLPATEAKLRAAMSRFEKQEAKAKIGADLKELKRDLREAEARLKAFEKERAKATAVSPAQRRLQQQQLQALEQQRDALRGQVREREDSVRVLDREVATLKRVENEQRTIEKATKDAAAARAKSARAAEQEAKATAKAATATEKEDLAVARMQRRLATIARDRRAMERITPFQRMMRSLPPLKQEYELETAGMEAEFTAIQAELRARGKIPIEQKLEIDVDYAATERFFGQIAKLGSATVRLGPLTMSLKSALMLAGALAPAIFNVIGAASALAGVFGGGLVGGITVATTALAGFAATGAVVAGLVAPQVSMMKTVTEAAWGYGVAVADAGKNSMEAAEAQKALQTALKGTPQQTAQSARAIAQMGSAWHRFQQRVREPVWNTFHQGVKTAAALMPIIGRRGVEATKAVSAGIQDWMVQLRSASAKNYLDTFLGNVNAAIRPAMSALGNLSAFLMRVGVSASRYLQPAANALNEWAAGLRNLSQGQIDAGVDALVQDFKMAGGFILAAARALRTFLTAGRESGHSLLQQMTDGLNEWNRAMQTTAGQKSLKGFFEDSASGVTKMWGALKPMLQLFYQWAKAMQPAFNGLMDAIKVIGNIFETLAGIKIGSVSVLDVAVWTMVAAKALQFLGVIKMISMALLALKGKSILTSLLGGAGAGNMLGRLGGPAAGGAAAGKGGLAAIFARALPPAMGVDMGEDFMQGIIAGVKGDTGGMQNALSDVMQTADRWTLGLAGDIGEEFMPTLLRSLGQGDIAAWMEREFSGANAAVKEFWAQASAASENWRTPLSGLGEKFKAELDSTIGRAMETLGPKKTLDILVNSKNAHEALNKLDKELNRVEERERRVEINARLNDHGMANQLRKIGREIDGFKPLKVKASLEDKGFQAKKKSILNDLKDVGRFKANPVASLINKADKPSKQLKKDLMTIHRTHPNPAVRLDAKRALVSLGLVDRKMKDADRSKANPKVNVENRQAIDNIGAVTRALLNIKDKTVHIRAVAVGVQTAAAAIQSIGRAQGGPVPGYAGGGYHSTAKEQIRGNIDSQVGETRGGRFNKPTFLVGEGSKGYGEMVIASDPRFKRENLRHWAQAGKMLGVPGFAEGGWRAGRHMIGTRFEDGSVCNPGDPCAGGRRTRGRRDRPWMTEQDHGWRGGDYTPKRVAKRRYRRQQGDGGRHPRSLYADLDGGRSPRRVERQIRENSRHIREASEAIARTLQRGERRTAKQDRQQRRQHRIDMRQFRDTSTSDYDLSSRAYRSARRGGHGGFFAPGGTSFVRESGSVYENMIAQLGYYDRLQQARHMGVDYSDPFAVQARQQQQQYLTRRAQSFGSALTAAEQELQDLEQKLSSTDRGGKKARERRSELKSQIETARQNVNEAQVAAYEAKRAAATFMEAPNPFELGMGRTQARYAMAELNGNTAGMHDALRDQRNLLQRQLKAAQGLLKDSDASNDIAAYGLIQDYAGQLKQINDTLEGASETIADATFQTNRARYEAMTSFGSNVGGNAGQTVVFQPQFQNQAPDPHTWANQAYWDLQAILSA